ncbi:DUF1003 domain-containing protein [Candidatus Peregrinibacteria bacterium]|nr:DUF1003 domain-containing protein [Candidatus Peregrinibacteria bacterium]
MIHPIYELCKIVFNKEMHPKESRELTSEEHARLIKERRDKIKSFRAKMDLMRRPSEKMADIMTDLFGSFWFLVLNAVFFLAWVLLNNNVIPGFKTFDPYPFTFLTMVVSLEAIFLAIIVLISQNRAAKIADLREEIDLQINVRAEEEITKILNILDAIHDHMGLPVEDDDELKEMKLKTSIDEIEKQIEEENKKK